MPDVFLLLISGLVGLVLSYLVVTVFNVGGRPDEALNRDLFQMIMQIGVQLSVAIFMPLKGIWNICTDITVMTTSRAKWVVALVLFVTATVLMHSYHYEILSIIDDGWTCAVVPLLRNVITPLLQIQRVLYAVLAPFISAFLIIQGQILQGFLSTFAACSHINLFRIFHEFSKAIFTGSLSITRWFGVGSVIDDDNNFYYNDFNIAIPINHTLTAVSMTQDVLSCACNRAKDLFNIAFVVTREPHVTAFIDNTFQVFIRILQIVFRLLFSTFPDIYLVTFKLERAIVEGGLAMDSMMIKILENFIKVISPTFKWTTKPAEMVFTPVAQTIAAGVHTMATIGINGPLHLLKASFDPQLTVFDPDVWSLDNSFSYLHRAVYGVSTTIQWLVYIMNLLVTDTADMAEVFTDKNIPLTLHCDWARDVKDKAYVSISYTAGCSAYNFGISSLNTVHIMYGLVVELLIKSIFVQEQNVFRTLQRWEGPQLPRNKVYTCEERKKITAYNYKTKEHNADGWVWTQDRAKCACDAPYGTTYDEDQPSYNPWCGQPSLNFDVFAPLDALVMHISHGILGPGFGDAFPFIDPIQNIEINLQAGSKSISKSIALPFALPPLTRTAIESVRVLTRVALSFGDIVTGNFFNYPVNCGHGMNVPQLEAKWSVEPHPGNTKLKPTEPEMRWNSCKTHAYKALQKPGERTPVCDQSNDSPECMCSYLQPLKSNSACLCIARYPDLDITSSSQQVGDLIEERFTSEDVAVHWCNSMIIEWTFQNTAAFADALDFMVSLGPINPTCDVMDRMNEDGLSAIGAEVGEEDRRSSSGYLIANTPTLDFMGEFMKTKTKLNHYKDLKSNSGAGCTIVPSSETDAVDENGQFVYTVDNNGKKTHIKVRNSARWSCDDSGQYVPISSLNSMTDKEEDKPGCRIWGRDDFFCSAGLFVRNSKRLSMNVARQVINDGISILAGNFADVNMGTLPRLCDYERQQGAVAAMIAGIIPGISSEMKKAFAKYINMLLQVVYVQTMRTALVLVNMVTTIIQEFVAGSVSKSNIKQTFKQGVDTIVSGYLWAIRYFFTTTGELLDSVSAGAGDICDSIVSIIDMLSKQLKNELMDLVSLGLDAFFNLLAAITGDTSAIGPFFTSAFSLWARLQTIIIRQMWQILDKIYDFFGPIGDFMKILTYGVCKAINGIMNAIDSAIRGITFGAVGLDWENMECVTPKHLREEHHTSGKLGNHTSGKLGKHFLRSHENTQLPRKIAEALDWNGTSVCDHFMSAAADYSYTELRPLEKAKWIECLEYKLIGVEIAKFLESKTFPTDIVYNWKRKYILVYDFVRAMKIVFEDYVNNDRLDWAHIRLMLYDQGLDADMYIRLSQKFLSVSGQITSSIEMTSIVEFAFENIDPEYKKDGNPSTTARMWKTFSNTKSMYQQTKQVWVEKDMGKQAWSAVDASYEAHGHLQQWWKDVGTIHQAEQTHTERLFTDLKLHLQHSWRENILRTAKHHSTPIKLKTPLKTGLQSCPERGNPGWCTDCVVLDNVIETVVEQGAAIANFYSDDFPRILNNVSGYFNELAEYNTDFFEGVYSRLQKSKVKIPKTSIRWTIYVQRDWELFFTTLWEYLCQQTTKETWLIQVDKFLDASRLFVKSTNDNYVPFYGYSLYHMYDYILFSSCDLEESIYASTTTEDERIERMDTALITCAVILLLIATNTTWSVIPLMWIANTLVMSIIVTFVYLYMVYGYFINCVPILPYTLAEDINAWYQTRLDPGCFYKILPYIARNASEDTCLTCAATQEYLNCGNYTIVNYQEGMLPLSEFIDSYYIAWPMFFWVRWQWPEIAIFLVQNGMVAFESVLGRLFMSAWQQEPVDPVWIDCYYAMWLDNILMVIIAVLVGYIAVKMTIIATQTCVQTGILIMYLYTTLNYMTLAVEKSVVVK